MPLPLTLTPALTLTLKPTVVTLPLALSLTLTQMNKCIITNGKAGLYDGCKVAVECALEKSFSAV